MDLNAKVFCVPTSELESVLNREFAKGLTLTPFFPIFQEELGGGQYQYVLIMLPAPKGMGGQPTEGELVKAARPKLLVPTG